MRDAARSANPAARPARILIVDEDPGAREALSDAVAGLGHTVCAAAEPGSPALHRFAGASPDLVLIGLEGGEAAVRTLEAAQQIAERLGIPTIYATDTADAVLLDRAQRTHPHGCVLKSGDPRQLDLAIRAALGTAARERVDRERHARQVDDLRGAVARSQERLAFFQRVFDNMNDPIIVIDVQGRFEAINEPARRILATYGASDVEQWFEHLAAYHADGVTRFATDDLPLMRASRGETTRDVRLVLRSQLPETEAIERWFDANGYPLLDTDGRCIGGAVVLRDVTTAVQQEAKAKRMEAELHQRVQVLDAIIRSMGDGVVVVDAQATFTLFNPSAERILGIGMTDRPPGEWTDLYGVFYPDRSTPVPADELPLVRAVRGEVVEDEEFFIRNPSVPAGVFISVTASPVRSESQEVVGGVSVLRDVSERKIEQEALSQAFAHGRLEVIDTVLHNIGNAINSVAIGMDTLHERYEDSELIRRFNALANLVGAHGHDWTTWLEHDAQGRRLRPFLLSLIEDLNGEQEVLRKTATRVRDRVRHIVDIIRTQESFTDGTVERKMVALRRAVNDAVRVIRESLGRRGVAMEVDCSRAPTEILVQESRFQQMLVNLLKNAMEAIDERAARLENDPGWRPAIRVLARQAERTGFLVIDIVDNGIGIDPARLSSVFNAGYTTKKNGSGLGLHSAANFVIGSGGTIHALSDGIGRGTTMRVTLRRAAKQVTPPDEGSG